MSLAVKSVSFTFAVDTNSVADSEPVTYRSSVSGLTYDTARVGMGSRFHLPILVTRQGGDVRVYVYVCACVCV